MTCVFCAIAKGEIAAHVVLESEAFLGFLDTKPLFFGHVLVAPRAHVPTLTDLPEVAIGPLFQEV